MYEPFLTEAYPSFPFSSPSSSSSSSSWTSSPNLPQVLFGFPIYQSVVKRLAAVATELGPGALSLMIDHLEQLSLLTNVFKISGHAPLVFLKADTAYARAGVVPGSAACASLIQGLLDLEQRGACVFHGAYAHAGHTVREHEEWEAMSYLAVEFIALQKVAAVVRAKAPDHQFVLSVGATPQTTTIQHPAFCADPADVPEMTTDGRQAPPTLLVEQLFNDLKGEGLELEVHAGVYPTLDLEQLATHARDTTLMKADDIAISILAEVASVYPERGRDKTTEALINAGSLALGRESLQNHGPPPREQYNGWGIVMPWMVDNVVPDEWFPSVHGGWQVGRMSQEHGILVWKGSRHVEAPLQVGQRVRVWPNHSCIAGAGFSQYFIIDSRKGDEIIDVWPRWRGW